MFTFAFNTQIDEIKMYSFFILKLSRTCYSGFIQTLCKALVFSLVLISNLFFSQITISGDAVVISTDQSQGYSGAVKDASVIIFIGQGTVVTNLQDIHVSNSDLKVVPGKQEIQRQASNKVTKITKSLEPKIAKKKVKFQQEIQKVSRTFSNRDSSDNLSLFNCTVNHQSISTNFNSSIVGGILNGKILVPVFAYISFQNTLKYCKVKHDFQYLLYQVTRPPPFYS